MREEIRKKKRDEERKIASGRKGRKESRRISLTSSKRKLGNVKTRTFNSRSEIVVFGESRFTS